MLVAYHYQILFLSEMRLTCFYLRHSIVKGLVCSCCQKALWTLLHNIITISLIGRYAVLLLYIGSLQLFYSIWLQINFRVLNKVQVSLLPVLVPQISFLHLPFKHVINYNICSITEIISIDITMHSHDGVFGKCTNNCMLYKQPTFLKCQSTTMLTMLNRINTIKVLVLQLFKMVLRKV